MFRLHALSVLLHCSHKDSRWHIREKERQQARTIYAPSIYSCIPLQPALCDCTPTLIVTRHKERISLDLCAIKAIVRATWTIWRYMSCPALISTSPRLNLTVFITSSYFIPLLCSSFLSSLLFSERTSLCQVL